ncbi:hypothetical protein SRABI27_00611 [Pedobacter sp. Bi27]|uniref:DUF3810 domain-containing protein n=1 Tax=unclassified Pedobacter TaxID=2628915 RepID=UPI001D6A48B0|nr:MULTISPECIES: DUF3810 domain-containing protein [unclassified Pedobacter]CAH0154284.1 hypothetical protein SRABI126_00613 [Pedobacter sp. Bi126]CAH0154699.1 hypothetical protein SRABI27_00611 [Pedobacter sp. Bi27]CAH0203998.1 hypothetical protein SRABI36_02067 [Pedobacter sp. Bi36]
MSSKKLGHSKTFIIATAAFLVFLLGLSESLTEKIYSNNLYPIISKLLRFLSALFPFAIGDVLYILLVACLLWYFFKIFKKYRAKEINLKQVGIKCINLILALYLVFKLSWALNYSRPAIAKKLGIADEKYNTAQLVTLGKYYLIKITYLKLKIDSMNSRPKQYSVAALSKTATRSYQFQAEQNTVFNYTIPSVKACLFANYVAKSGIEGYYNPLSGEANINMNLPPFILPFTICHEIAHQTGIAKEDEANLLGYITAIKSDDINFQYAGYYCMFRSILWEIRMKSPNDYQMIFDRIAPTVLADFKTENQFWLKNNSDMSKYMSVAFDRLLKLNNQKKGIDSYQDIVLWLYNYHKKDLEKTLSRSSSESWITKHPQRN